MDIISMAVITEDTDTIDVAIMVEDIAMAMDTEKVVMKRQTKSRYRMRKYKKTEVLSVL